MPDRAASLVGAAAAVAQVLASRPTPRREIVASVDVDERLLGEDYPWRWIVLARTHDEEWLVYGVRPASPDDPPGDGDYVVEEPAMLVADRGNALSHADALLRLLGIATGITD